MSQLRRFWGQTLTRRIYGWFGLTILATLTVVAIVMSIIHASGLSAWQKEVNRFETFTGNHLASLWDRPDERDGLIDAMARDLEINARLETPEGQLLIARGPSCDCNLHGRTIKIMRQDQQLGTLTVCKSRRPKAPLFVLIGTLLFVYGVLWLASLKIAREIGRPLRELSQVARALGDGDLSARAVGAEGSADEIRTRAGALNEMAVRIEQQLRAQRRLLAEVSHELRTPLGHLRLIVEILREGGDQRRRLDDLEREVVEMDDLVDQLLANSRLDFELRQRQVLSATEVTLEAIERAGLDPTLLEVLDDCHFEGDATLIGRALANLIRNGSQHGRGVTALRVERRGNDVAFLVEDKGPGLPDDERQRLFDPFVRFDTLAHNGTLGLGLFLVRRIADAHGGDVIAEQCEGGGARVGFRLPPSA